MATHNPYINGVDTDQLFDTIDAIQAKPDLARFEFRATNKWIQGGENHTTVRDFYGAGREDDSRVEPFVWVNGEPPVLLGHNEGGNPVEYLLHALAGCVTTTLVIHAASRGIRLERIATRLEGDLDARGVLGLDPSIFPGYQGIRVKMDVKADCSDEVLAEMIEYAQSHSPVFQSLARPIDVRVERAKVEPPLSRREAAAARSS